MILRLLKGFGQTERKDKRMISMLRAAAHNARYVLSSIIADAAGLYRLGGVLGILVGVTASMVAYQIRRFGR
jgi:hypothetical protein